MEVNARLSQEKLKFILENINIIPISEIAIKLGYSPVSFRSKLTKWRRSGYDIPMGKKVKDKEQVVKHFRDNVKYVPVLKTTKKKILKPEKNNKRKSVFATREIDLSNCTKLYIPEKRLTVYVRPNSDIDAIRKRYLQPSY